MVRLLIVALRRSKRFLSVLFFILVLMMIKYHSGRESSPHGVSIRGGSTRKLNSKDSASFENDNTKHESFANQMQENMRKKLPPLKEIGLRLPSLMRDKPTNAMSEVYKKTDRSPKGKFYVVRERKRLGAYQLFHPFKPGSNNIFSRGRHPPSTLDSPMIIEQGVKIRKDDPIVRARKPTSGEPWPIPHVFRKDTTVTYRLDTEQYKIDISGSRCDVLDFAISRHKNRLERMKSERSPREQNQGLDYNSIGGIHIRVEHLCSGTIYPTLDSDESYELFLDDGNIILKASEVWGAVYGLETLTQLVRAGEDGQLLLDRFDVQDFPRFKHRGIMIDTARHFLSIPIIKKNLDAMIMNKFNVLHWHIVDDQSFPFESKTFPELSVQGAFSSSSVYKFEDIAEVIEYARVRGIRVIPEFDVPGHVQSWLGLSHILTPCDTESSYGSIDPSKNLTYSELRLLYSEILDVFPGQTVHFGGDECSYYCWSRNKNIREFMETKDFGEDYKALFAYFISRLRVELARNSVKPGTSIYWQEIFDENVEIDPNDILHVWKNNHEIKLSEITMKGHKAILSSCWYLNYVEYGSDWKTFYQCDPHRFSGNLDQKRLVLGGEACMWGEYVDDTNILQLLWPRVSAVAERLWSPISQKNVTAAAGRFEENRCRLIRNGIPASPNGGPGPNC